MKAEQQDRNEEIDDSDGDAVHRAEIGNSIARHGDGENERSEYPRPLNRIERRLGGLLQQTIAILAPVRAQGRIKQVLNLPP